MNQNTSPRFVQLGYFYLCLPVLIFILGWCNLPTAMIGSLVFCVSFYLLCKNAPKLWTPQNTKQKRLLIGIALISLVWVCLSGIGALVFQNLDHNCRNPLFEILVQAPWPVTVTAADKGAILTYYIGFWLPSALIGKLVHSIQIGYYCQIAWATLGIFLFFYFTLACLKRKNYWPVVIFIFFSGLDAVGNIISNRLPQLLDITYHIEWWIPLFQFSSFTTQLFWVFNQAVPAWVAVMLMYHEKNNKNLLFLYACLFLQSTLPALGLFPFVVYWYAKNGNGFLFLKNGLTHFKEVIFSSLTFQNIAGSIVVVSITFSYLSGNISGGHQEIIILSFPQFCIWLGSFFLTEAGLFLLCLYKCHRHNVLFYLVAICLFVYPFFQVGSGPDFCMRATIPALVLLYLMVLQNLESASFKKRQQLTYYALIVCLCIGSITPLHEFARTFYYTSKGITKVKSNLSFNNFFGWTENNRFLIYFGKNTKN